MPSWKKLITSGSDAAIPSISHTGNFTLDVSGDITLDADGTDILLKDGGTEFGRFKRDSSDFVIKSATNNKDIVFRGQDGGGTITALTLDMSEAGDALFNNDIMPVLLVPVIPAITIHFFSSEQAFSMKFKHSFLRDLNPPSILGILTPCSAIHS